jgi:hypothetical protein
LLRRTVANQNALFEAPIFIRAGPGLGAAGSGWAWALYFGLGLLQVEKFTK